MRGLFVKKFGFTLAEVMIAVAILGIISTLTIPQLARDIQRKNWANALSTQITNFENATKNLIVNSNAIDMYDTEILNPNTDPENFPKYLKNLESYNEENFEQFYNKKVYKINKQPLDNINKLDNKIDDYTNYNLKGRGNLFLNLADNKNNYYTYEEDEALEKEINYRTKIADVIIDINGKNSPNTLGRDIFKFDLDENGKLHAQGSKDVSLYSNNNNLHWEKTCPDTNITDIGTSCTGRLVENNFVMDY